MTKFWKPILAVLLVCALALSGGTLLAEPAASAASETPASTAAASQAAPVSAGEEFRAVWVATVYRLDYPSQATTDPAVLKRDADAILQECVELGMNAVILQVRPSADALYPSDYYPWSRYLTGTQGTAPRNGFDPLEYWVERAHALELELHAWLNPFRITKGGQTEFDSLTADHPAKLHPDWVVEYEGEFYFNPGLPEVRAYIIRGAEELARNYDIDGVHLDDYFYPGSGFDDADTYAQYGAGFSDLGDWRRDNVNQLVEELGERLHAIDPNLSYGISPSGVWADRSSLPQGSNTTGGYESYYASYADSRKWVKEGWIDYICPQIYWYIGHRSMDYATVARWWADTVDGTGVELYIGMADYLADNADPASPWYGTKAIQAQLELNDTLPQVAGEVHFRYQFLADSQALGDLYRQWYGTAEPEEPVGEAHLNTAEHEAYIQGSDGLFRPEASLSRAEAVTMLARLSVDGDGNPLYTGAAGTGGFSDVSRGDWYAPYVAFAQKYGIASGYPDGTFRPEQPVSRAELVKLLSSYFEVSGGTAAFPDVAAGYWAAGVISFAAQQGWVSGYPDGTFRPDAPVGRAEAVKILNHALDRRAGERPASLPFTDVPKDHWAYDEIREAAVSHTYQKTDDGEKWLTYDRSPLNMRRGAAKTKKTHTPTQKKK